MLALPFFFFCTHARMLSFFLYIGVLVERDARVSGRVISIITHSARYTSTRYKRKIARKYIYSCLDIHSFTFAYVTNIALFKKLHIHSHNSHGQKHTHTHKFANIYVYIYSFVSWGKLGSVHIR